MSGTGPPRFYEIPPIGKPFGVRGLKDLGLVLDEFTPTHLDSWRGRAVFPLSLARGVPSATPLTDQDAGAVVASAVVVRHAGNLTGGPVRFGARRHRLDLLLTARPELTPLVGVVVEAGETSLVWVDGGLATVAAALSRPDWRASVG